MADESNVLIIGTKPLHPDAIAATLDVMGREPTLGDATNRLMKFGQISLGRADIVTVPQMVERDSHQPAGGVRASTCNQYLVKLPFTIHSPFDGTRYEKVVLRVHFSDPRVIAYDLEPKRVTKEKKKHVQFELTPEFKFREVLAAKLGSASYGLEFQVLEPTIIAYGQGENNIYWEYRKRSDQDDGIAVGTRGVGISLCVPNGKQQVMGSINYGMDMRWKLLRGWQELPGRTDEYSFIWDLPVVAHNDTPSGPQTSPLTGPR